MNARIRGWTQFSLRTFLGLMLIVGVFFCGYRVGHSKGRYERSRDPQDSFDDLIALISETTTPTPWIITDPSAPPVEKLDVVLHSSTTITSAPEPSNVPEDDPFK